MEYSARGANAEIPSGDGENDSPLAALSGIAGRVRAVAGEKFGPDAGERRRSVAGGKPRPGPGGPGRGAPAGAGIPAPPFEERPELYVGAAFAGGIVLAGFIRLLGR